MHASQFQQILDEQLDTCQQMLGAKAEEYASDKDRLHNFRVAGAIQGESMQEALGGMMVKHTTSVYDMIGTPDKEFSMELWSEKITDHINYLILLKAVLIDQQETVAAEAPAKLDLNETSGLVEAPSGTFITHVNVPARSLKAIADSHIGGSYRQPS